MIIVAPFSAMAMVGLFVLPDVMRGMTLASTTRRPLRGRNEEGRMYINLY
jgi:hypothetical protein